MNWELVKLFRIGWWLFFKSRELFDDEENDGRVYGSQELRTTSENEHNISRRACNCKVSVC